MLFWIIGLPFVCGDIVKRRRFGARTNLKKKERNDKLTENSYQQEYLSNFHKDKGDYDVQNTFSIHHPPYRAMAHAF